MNGYHALGGRALAIGALANVACRPDLMRNTLLAVAAPGYIELEERAFGFTFGMYWTGIYEHFARTRRTAAGAAHAPGALHGGRDG